MLILVLILVVILLALLHWDLAIMNENARGAWAVLIAINEKLDRVIPAKTDDPDDDELDDLDDEDIVYPKTSQE